MEEETESLILEALRKEVSLKTVNSYKENLLHVVAANGCSRIVKEILEKEICDINRKNVFGWTPLMQAIRNGKIDCVKILLTNGANITEATYLGMSTIGLATAVGKKMFETVYKFYPSALEMAALDEISPLGIASMNNDKDLFFRLLELGLDPLKSNTWTQLMMKSSLVPEISSLAKPLQDIESYWNDCTDNIKIVDNLDNFDNPKMRITKKKVDLPRIFIYKTDAESSRYMELNNKKEKFSLISPNLTYNYTGAFPPSPKSVFSRDETKNIVDNNGSDSPVRRCQKYRPPDLEFFNESQDLNVTLSFVPEYSPTKSPNVPPEIEDENAVFGETTPTPPHGMAPPKAFLLSPKDAPLGFLLHKHGLDRHIAIFLEQELDLGLFLTLNDQDLKEIGIESETDRITLLSVINECKERGVFY